MRQWAAVATVSGLAANARSWSSVTGSTRHRLGPGAGREHAVHLGLVPGGGQPLRGGGILRREVGERQDRLVSLDEELDLESRLLGRVRDAAADLEARSFEGGPHGGLPGVGAVLSVPEGVGQEEGGVPSALGIFAAPADHDLGAQLGG